MSMRDTTPCVMARLSPPTGKPTTVTSSCSAGSDGESAIASTPFQNSLSSTVSSARSHSRPMATTSATYLVASPRFFTLTTAKLSTQCAFVRMRRPEMTKPEEVEDVCLRICHGSE